MTKLVKIAIKRLKEDLKTNKTAILLIALYYLANKAIFHAFCPLLITVGLPCPGCGMTRAMYCLATFQWKRALLLNPTAPAWLIYIIYLAWRRYIVGSLDKKKNTIFLAVLCIVTIAVYIFRMVKYFPGPPPLVYYKDNILLRIVKSMNRFFK